MQERGKTDDSGRQLRRGSIPHNPFKLLMIDDNRETNERMNIEQKKKKRRKMRTNFTYLERKLHGVDDLQKPAICDTLSKTWTAISR